MALEPEAASIYCQHLHLEKDDVTDDRFMQDVKAGTKYMVVDLGGEFSFISIVLSKINNLVAVILALMTSYLCNFLKIKPFRNIEDLDQIHLNFEY